MDGDALYDKAIVSRARAPFHVGSVEPASARAEGINPLCGDRVRLTLRLEAGQIAELRHDTRGCAICIASADLMAEAVSGCVPAQAEAMGVAFITMLAEQTGAISTELPESLSVFTPLRAHRSRIRCATLPWTALGEALIHVES